jgi:hypothetical protein
LVIGASASNNVNVGELLKVVALTSMQGDLDLLSLEPRWLSAEVALIMMLPEGDVDATLFPLTRNVMALRLECSILLFRERKTMGFTAQKVLAQSERRIACDLTSARDVLKLPFLATRNLAAGGGILPPQLFQMQLGLLEQRRD